MTGGTLLDLIFLLAVVRSLTSQTDVHKMPV